MDNLKTAIDALILAHDISIDYGGYSDTENLKALINEMRSHISAAITMIAKEQDAHKREIVDDREEFRKKLAKELTKPIGMREGLRYMRTICERNVDCQGCHDWDNCICFKADSEKEEILLCDMLETLPSTWTDKQIDKLAEAIEKFRDYERDSYIEDE